MRWGAAPGNAVLEIVHLVLAAATIDSMAGWNHLHCEAAIHSSHCQNGSSLVGMRSISHASAFLQAWLHPGDIQMCQALST